MKKNIANIVNHADVSEKMIECYLCDSVKQMGGVCLKYSNAGMVGYPDRMRCKRYAYANCAAWATR